ncbi:MAG: undecaprenyl-diphosphate phosphatase [Candidatus Symbiothrix sp.]|jgi:undecaprenyl-diphosphatase|nr:undecaprenyl-diphosphate phosphatase [Candidatus Symbiothrix sp.]
MSVLHTIIIAIVEGLTEFLPVSSTGHMIIAEAICGVESTDFVKAFTVIIQFGAILSVVVLYHQRFFKSWRFYKTLIIAFLPAGFVGILLGNKIDALLENVPVIASMLILGGIFMLFADKLFTKASQSQAVTDKKAFLIGCCQCIALIPGVSRSMATTVGGMAQQLTRKHAAEFSFFLAVPTMFAATAYKFYKLVKEPDGPTILSDNLGTLLLGNLVAFVVAFFSMKLFIEVLTKYGFKPFGYYRIIVGGTILILMALGYNLQIV